MIYNFKIGKTKNPLGIVLVVKMWYNAEGDAFMKLGKVFILGDSYSTFEKCVPEGYAIWYQKDIVNDTDVNSVEQTWWKQLINSTDSEILLNCSWSGTTICHTGYSGDCSDISFIARFDRLAEEGYFEKNNVDTLLVFGGTNDNWANSPIGEPMYSDWKKEDLFSFLPAMGYLTQRLKDVLPETRIIFIINSDLKKEITEGIKTACQKKGIEAIELKNIEKQSGHPNKAGMTQIKEQIMEYLISNS